MTDNEILRVLLDGALRSLESVAKMAGELTSGNVAHAAPAIKGRRCAGWSISKRCYMKTNSDNFFVSPCNFSPESFGVSQKHAIFATSNLKRGMNAAGYYPAVFVPTLYWNHRITMPCRESGNRPGASAFKSLTARSMVTFLCQNLNEMQIRKENVPAFTLVTWREMLTGVARKWQEWKASENVWLSAWCQERVTNGECAATAIVVCLVFPALLCLLGLVLEGGAV